MAFSRRLAQVALGGVVALVLALAVCPRAAAEWAVAPRGSLLLDEDSVSEISELSGVTYVGPAGGGLDRFVAVQDDGNQFVFFDVDFATDGVIQSASAVLGLGVSPGFDFEGIAYRASHGTVFISEENTPGVREYSLSTGNHLGSIALPSVFSAQRFNRGLESLARSLDGTTMWTANEGALTADGPDATDSQGTTVRLLRLDDNGSSVTVGPQFAYEVDPIHASAAGGQSGMSDLVILPDDTLLALERSTAPGASPPFRSRIYQIDFAGATNVSVPPYSSGLIGQSYTPVSKTLLWSGQAGTMFGENLEGLALGPQLESGNWVLLGVVDNAGESFGSRIVSFELSEAPTCTLTGDYDCNGTVEEEDFDLWRVSFGLMGDLPADGNNDGIVDGADYTVWRDNLVEPLPEGASTDETHGTYPVPEPDAAMLLWMGSLMARRGIRSGHGSRLSVTFYAENLCE